LPDLLRKKGGGGDMVKEEKNDLEFTVSSVETVTIN